MKSLIRFILIFIVCLLPKIAGAEIYSNLTLTLSNDTICIPLPALDTLGQRVTLEAGTAGSVRKDWAYFVFRYPSGKVCKTDSVEIIAADKFKLEYDAGVFGGIDNYAYVRPIDSIDGGGIASGRTGVFTVEWHVRDSSLKLWSDWFSPFQIIPGSIDSLGVDGSQLAALDNAIDASVIAADAIGASELATDAIGAAEVASGALTLAGTEIGTDAITATTIQADAIGASEVASGALSLAGTEIGTDAITATTIQADAIGAAELAASAIGTSEWAAEADNNGINWADIDAPTTTFDLSGTTIATTQKVDVNTWKTGTIPAPTTTGVPVVTTKFWGTSTTALAANVEGMPVVDLDSITVGAGAGSVSATEMAALSADSTAKV